MSSPDLTDAERRAVAEVLETPYLSMGPNVKAFEAAFAQFAQAKHAVAVNSGTSGLHLCVRAANISDGDWVITTPFSFVSSSNVLLFERALPVFVDVDPKTGNIDPSLIAQAATDLMKGGEAAKAWLPRTGVRPGGSLKAILAVDIFGQPADYDPIVEVAKAHGIPIIEDSCEALGATYKGRLAGMLGDVGVYAFYPNKQITTGEGGIVVTNHEEWGVKIRAMCNQGRMPGDLWLDHTTLGYNYRLDEMSAALGRVQMTRLEELLGKRERVAGWYDERLAEIPGVERPYLHPDTTQLSWFIYVVRLAPHFDRNKVIMALREEGIPSRPYFSPIHLQKYYVERFGYQPGDFPTSEDLGRRSMALPFSGVMQEHQVVHVCETLHRILATRS